MVLTVHDELVLDVAERAVEPAGALVKEAMESAYDVSVGLRADLGSGKNWAEAVPSGH
jgi:DNA polymerase-1